MCRIEMLRHRNKRDVELIERPHHLGKVEQRSAEPIDLVDYNTVDLASLDVFHQSLERWPFDIATGEASVVVTIVNDLPTFALLASNVRFGCFALGVERVELLIESFFRGLASVDRATNGFRARWVLLLMLVSQVERIEIHCSASR